MERVSENQDRFLLCFYCLKALKDVFLLAADHGLTVMCASYRVFTLECVTRILIEVDN
jgi:hypothetical protein